MAELVLQFALCSTDYRKKNYLPAVDKSDIIRQHNKHKCVNHLLLIIKRKTDRLKVK